jgi:hypothetical protein
MRAFTLAIMATTFLALVIITGLAQAQSIEICKKVQGAKERLECFDKLPVPKTQLEKSISGKTDAGAGGATEAKRRKQAEEDEIVMSSMPVETLSAGCILAAAQLLPRIPGISIEASRAVPLPPEYKKEPGLYRTIVEIDAKGAGVAATYRFICVKGPRSPSMVTGIR